MSIYGEVKEEKVLIKPYPKTKCISIATIITIILYDYINSHDSEI